MMEQIRGRGHIRLMGKFKRIQHILSNADLVLEQGAVDRIKDKHKKENEKVKTKQDRELDTAKEREIASNTRDKDRELRRKRLAGG